MTTLVSVPQARIELDVHPPLDWVLVRLDEPMEATRGGLLVPGQSKPPARTGVIVAQGLGALSDDGRTRMPMCAKVGDRVLFERAAGKNLPRAPRETSEREGWGYVLMRDGSICAVIAAREVSSGEQRALDAGAAGLPPRPEGGPPVSKPGQLSAERLLPVQDWLVLQPDAPLGETEPARALSVAGKNGRTRKKLILPERTKSAQPETEDLWSAVVLRRGPGLVTITRCLDGDRMGTAPRVCKAGDRVLLSAAPPWAQPIEDFAPLACGAPFLARETPCQDPHGSWHGVVAVLGA